MVSIHDLIKNINRITKELKNHHHKHKDGTFSISYDSYCEIWIFEYNSYCFDYIKIEDKDYNNVLNLAKVKLFECYLKSKELN